MALILFVLFERRNARKNMAGLEKRLGQAGLQMAIACLIEARLGEKAFVYGDFVRKVFSEGTISTCWKKKLTEYEIGTSGFSSFFREYMTQGFGLEELCGYVKLQDKDGQDIHRNDDQ